MVRKIWSVTDKIFFSILDRFLLFYPPNNPKNQNFKKLKKITGGFIILHTFTINDNHMTYGFWDIKRNGWGFFCHFRPFSKFWKSGENNPEISSFYTGIPKIMFIYYTVPKIWGVTDVIVIFYFGLFFARKIKISKN